MAAISLPSFTPIIHFDRLSTPYTDRSAIALDATRAKATTEIKDFTNIVAKAQSEGAYVLNAKNAGNILDGASDVLADIAMDLMTMRDYAVAMRSVTTTATSSYREAVITVFDAAFKELVDHINTISQGLEYRDTRVLNGGFEKQLFQVGPKVSDAVSITINSATPYGLGVGGLSIDSHENAAYTVEAIDTALATLTTIANNVNQTKTTLNEITKGHYSFSLLKQSDGDMQNHTVQISSAAKNHGIRFDLFKKGSVTTALYHRTEETKKNLLIVI